MSNYLSAKGGGPPPLFSPSLFTHAIYPAPLSPSLFTTPFIQRRFHHRFSPTHLSTAFQSALSLTVVSAIR